MKIAFTGPESSGKTSISKHVSDTLGGQWFPEYAREYLTERNGVYSFEDIEQIGRKQEETRSEATSDTLNVYDTEGLVLYIWSDFKYKKVAPFIQKLLMNQEYDYYFLCSPEGIDWKDDPLREHPFQREELFEIYLKELTKLNIKFTVLEGDFNQRVKTAISIIESLRA